MPIPSGYFCHTSCAIGKGRQPQQYDCPLSLTLRRRGLPQFHPRGPIFIDHSRRHRSAHFLFSRAPHPDSCVKTSRNIKKDRKKKNKQSSFRGIAKTPAAVLRDPTLFPREGENLSLPTTKASPHDSLFLRVHLPCRSKMSSGIKENSAKLGSGPGSITSAWLKLKWNKFDWEKKKLEKTFPRISDLRR